VSGFHLHEDFARGSLPLADLPLCSARLQDDSRFLWVILVPRRPGLVEIEDLLPGERALLLEEATEAGRRVRRIGEALGRPVEKLNTAALGNVTRQLHVHVIGRRSDDAAWPRPVWGVGEATPWEPGQAQEIARLWQG
jgi:diadenosine tetraphosphate (Ap4A) HIT family hydrolase